MTPKSRQSVVEDLLNGRRQCLWNSGIGRFNEGGGISAGLEGWARF
jgi:hypothetical protein